MNVIKTMLQACEGHEDLEDCMVAAHEAMVEYYVKQMEGKKYYIQNNKELQSTYAIRAATLAYDDCIALVRGNSD